MSKALALELVVLTLLTAAGAALIPLSTGFMAWSWDALNHHIYLGLVAESPRWHLDVLAASHQSYQYPYLYWPVYRLSLLTGSGATVGALWSGFQAALLLPPVWFLSHYLLPTSGPAWQGAAQRLAACVLAFASTLVLTGIETTGNDVLASVPLLWALVLGMRPKDSMGAAFGAAALWGVSVAFKLSNAIFLPLMLVLWWVPERPHWPWSRAAVITLGVVAGFALTYAPWGKQLWDQTGNPFYPFLSGLFPTRS